jgi:hypothetical protein
MVATVGLVLVGMLAGIYVVLFNVVGRLPR